MQRVLVSLAILVAPLFGQAAPADLPFQPHKFFDIEQALGGTIPFPPEKFVESLLSLDKDSIIISSILPHGRSLERSVTDFHDPRTVMVWQGTVASNAPYFLYFAYTPNAEELEVIAWNWERRQFDFELVRDYAPGKKASTVNASRPLCMACHQNGGPIFPRIPWNETDQNIEILGQLHAHAEDSLSRYILGLSLDPSVRVRLETSVMDSQVHNGNTLLQNQSICMNACGGDLDCRKGVLLSALLESLSRGNSSNISTLWRDKMDLAMREVWPKDGFGFLDDAISDRILILGLPLRFGPSQDPLRWRDVAHAHEVVEGTGSILLAGYSQCWSFTQEQRRMFTTWGAARLDSAMNTQQMTDLVKTWLPSENAILSAISSAVTTPQSIDSDGPVPWEPPGENPGPISDPNRPKQSTTVLFSNYCIRCHGGPSTRPPILPLADLHKLSLYVGSADRTVKMVLDPKHPLMPPLGARQPTVQERQQMLSELR